MNWDRMQQFSTEKQMLGKRRNLARKRGVKKPQTIDEDLTIKLQGRSSQGIGNTDKLNNFQFLYSKM